MKHVAALLLLKLGGNDAPDAAAIKAVIEAAGGEADEAAITSLLGDLEGKDVNELITEGKELLKNVSLGGGGGGGAAASAAAAPAASEAPKKEEKKVEEEEVDLGAGSMFGGGGDGY